MIYRAIVKDQGRVVVVFEHHNFLELCKLLEDEIVIRSDGKERQDEWDATVEFSNHHRPQELGA